VLADPVRFANYIVSGPSRLQRWFPIGAWLPKYDWGSSLTPDLIAAISVAALLIPESIGYASVAGLPSRSACMPLRWPCSATPCSEARGCWSSIRGLKRYASRYDVEILIARLHADARQTLARDGVLAEIGEGHIYDSVQAAVAASNGPAEQQDKSTGPTEQEDKGPGG